MKHTAFCLKLIASTLISLMVSLPVLAAETYDEALLNRIKPVGEICLAGDESCAKAAPVVAAKARTGEEIFNSVCTACHSTGVLGAPKIGDHTAWAPRIATGKETLYKYALHGLNNMPPRGTCSDCSDDEIKATVDYIVSKSK